MYPGCIGWAMYHRVVWLPGYTSGYGRYPPSHPGYTLSHHGTQATYPPWCTGYTPTMGSREYPPPWEQGVPPPWGAGSTPTMGERYIPTMGERYIPTMGERYIPTMGDGRRIYHPWEQGGVYTPGYLRVYTCHTRVPESVHLSHPDIPGGVRGGAPTRVYQEVYNRCIPPICLPRVYNRCKPPHICLPGWV